MSRSPPPPASNAEYRAWTVVRSWSTLVTCIEPPCAGAAHASMRISSGIHHARVDGAEQAEELIEGVGELSVVVSVDGALAVGVGLVRVVRVAEEDGRA